MKEVKPTWRKAYKELYLKHIKETAFEFYRSSGGDDYQVTIPSDKKANGLTKLIIKFLQLKGHYANRINSQGQLRGGKVVRYEAFSNKAVMDNTMKWTKGQTTKGTPDIDAIVFGKPVKIEVKIGKDKMSAAQLKQQQLIEMSGGYFVRASDMQSFYDWYMQTFES